jgi:hypothetical protein
MMETYLPMAPMAAILLAAYYVTVRATLSRAMKSDSVVVQYVPPDDLSPAQLRLVRTGFTDGTSIAATIAQIARKGGISIVKNGDGSFLLVRKVATTSTTLSLEERVLMDKLFAKAFVDKVPEADKSAAPIEGDPVFEFAPLKSTILRPTILGEDQKRMAASAAALHEIARKTIQGKYYRWNFAFVLAGMAVTLGYGLWNALGTHSREPVVFLTIWFFCFAQIASALMMLNGTRTRMRGRPSYILGTVAMWLLILGIPALVAKKVMVDVHVASVMTFATMIALNSIFTPLLRTPTREGILLRAKIAGYREFLQSVARERLDRLAREGHDPTADEHLAYAIALDVDESWGDALETTATSATSMA